MLRRLFFTVIACNKREAFVQGSASDETIQTFFAALDCFASLAMTRGSVNQTGARRLLHRVGERAIFLA